MTEDALLLFRHPLSSEGKELFQFCERCLAIHAQLREQKSRRAKRKIARLRRIASLPVKSQAFSDEPRRLGAVRRPKSGARHVGQHGQITGRNLGNGIDRLRPVSSTQKARRVIVKQ